jgi:predicted RNA-binding protein Jag
MNETLLHELHAALQQTQAEEGLPLGCFSYRVETSEDGRPKVVVLQRFEQDHSEELYGGQRQELLNLLQDLFVHLGHRPEIKSRFSDRELQFSIEAGDLPQREFRGCDLSMDLQTILTRYYHSRYPEGPWEIRCDLNGWRLDRESQLADRARQAAASLLRPGDSVTLEPMNSFERRIVHLALEDQPAFRTSSEGQGSLKKVKIVRLPDETSS